MIVALVVSTPGNMARRAEALREHLPDDWTVRVRVRPDLFELLALLRDADVAYVIDAGRNGFAAGAVARALRRPVVFELGDPQAPLFRVQGRSAAAVSAGAAIDRLVARRATGVVVRGRELAQLLDLRVPWAEIPDGVDVDVFAPPADDATRAELGVPPERLLAGVIGAVGPPKRRGLGYGWDLVEALALTGADVAGLGVGGGAGLDALERRAAELGVADRTVFTGRVEHARIPQLIGAMDVCISTQTNDAVGRARTTAKLPEYLACDRYVLATDVGAAAHVLPPEMRIPYAGSWDPEYPEKLAERLRALVARREELRRGVGTRAIAVERYAYPVLARKLAEFLGRVEGER